MTSPPPLPPRTRRRRSKKLPVFGTICSVLVAMSLVVFLKLWEKEQTRGTAKDPSPIERVADDAQGTPDEILVRWKAEYDAYSTAIWQTPELVFEFHKLRERFNAHVDALRRCIDHEEHERIEPVRADIRRDFRELRAFHKRAKGS